MPKMGRRHPKYQKVHVKTEVDALGFPRRYVNRDGRKRSKPMVYVSHNRLACALRGRAKLTNFALGLGLRA